MTVAAQLNPADEDEESEVIEQADETIQSQ